MYKLINKIFIIICFLPVCLFSDQTLNAIGNLFPSAQCKLGSQVSGRIQEVYVEVGDVVTKGQPLAKLDTSQFEIDVIQKNTKLEATKIELADAETNYLRMKKLWEKPQGETPSISLKRYEDAKLRYDQAKVQVVAAEESLKLAKIVLDEALIKASFDGIITKKFVDPGDAVASNPVTPVVEIQSANPLYLEFSLSQVYLNSVKVGTPIYFSVEGGDAAKYEAKIDRIYPSIDEMTRSVKCRAVIDNSTKNLRLGSLAKVEIGKP